MLQRRKKNIVSDESKYVSVVNREQYIDVVRGVGIILMIIGHSGAPRIVTKYIYGFHMPLFFILSGYLYNSEKWNRCGIKGLIKSKYYSYIKPYFKYAFINLLINGFIEATRMDIYNLIISTGKHILWIFYSYGSDLKMPYCTPLWFLPCIFICNLYMYILMKISNKWIQYLICIGAVGIDVALMVYDVPQLPWHIETALVGTVFMFIGYNIKSRNVLEYIDNRKYVLIAITLIGIVSISLNDHIDFNTNYLSNPLFMIMGGVSISLLLICMCKWRDNGLFLSFIGKNTIWAMAYNLFLNRICSTIKVLLPILQDCPFFWWIKSIMVVIIIYLCLGISYLIKKRKLLKKLK